jgi:hypothetical protein
MDEIKVITGDRIPCWYELSWREEIPAIVLGVHKDFIASIKPILQDAPIVLTLRHEFNFGEFIGTFDGNFGFDNAFRRVEDSGDFVEFLAEIPKVKKQTNKRCDRCRGSGKEDSFDSECLSCGGTGKEYEMDWRAAYAVSANFTIFTILANFPKIETSALLPQLLTIETVTQTGAHGGSLGGEYSIPLVRWMSSFGANTEIPEMVKAMKMAYDRMLGLREFNKLDFRARIDYEDGWLNVDCPGEACGLNPNHGSEYNMKQGLGYGFSCHNTDTPMQQITLLAGLAALHDRARKEIKKY